MDIKKLITKQDWIADHFPEDETNSLRIGNGDIGVAIYRTTESFVFELGKNDIIDYRENPEGFSPWVPLPSCKTAGRLRIRTKNAEKELSGRLQLYNAQLSCYNENKQVFNAFVCKNRNMIVTQYHSGGDEALDLELARHKDCTGFIDSVPEFGFCEDHMWLTYKFPASPTYPNGFEYAVVTKIINGEIIQSDIFHDFADRRMDEFTNREERPKVASESIVRSRITSGKTVLLLTVVKTTHDHIRPMEAAKKEISQFSPEGLDSIIKEHRELWHSFWARSYVIIKNKEFLTQQWYLNQYHLAIQTRPDSVAPGLIGPNVFDDFPQWGNDRHWDYNMQAALWAAFSSNHLELAQAYNNEVYDLLPVARQMAKEKGYLGAKYPDVSWPLNYHKNPIAGKWDNNTLWINGFIAQPIWWYYEYSQDKEFLREKGYEIIRDCAECYRAAIVKNEKGWYETPRSAIWDLAFVMDDPTNAAVDIAFAKVLMRNAIAASEILDVDAYLRPLWQDILDHIIGYPTTIINGDEFKPLKPYPEFVSHYINQKTPSGEVLTMASGLPVVDYNLPGHTISIFPAGDIGMDSNQCIKKIAERTLQVTPYHLLDDLVLLTMAWVRMGLNIIDKFEEFTRYILKKNGCQTYPPTSYWSKWIFTHYLGWPLVINECIVQSYNGKLRFAPVRLDNDVLFGGLRTVGAFIVSGEIKSGGRIKALSIMSEAGCECRIVKPWDKIRIVDEMSGLEIEYIEEADIITFSTKKGRNYRFEEYRSNKRI